MSKLELKNKNNDSNLTKFISEWVAKHEIDFQKERVKHGMLHKKMKKTK